MRKKNIEIGCEGLRLVTVEVMASSEDHLTRGVRDINEKAGAHRILSGGEAEHDDEFVYREWIKV